MTSERTGATEVVAFSHQIRSHSAQQVKEMADGLQQSEVLKAVGPTQFAHCDNSNEGALPVLKENVSPSEFERRQQSRWGIMNARDPL